MIHSRPSDMYLEIIQISTLSCSNKWCHLDVLLCCGVQRVNQTKLSLWFQLLKYMCVLLLFFSFYTKFNLFQF